MMTLFILMDTSKSSMVIERRSAQLRCQVLAGSEPPGSKDSNRGMAEFIQPTGICAEGNSLFIVDSAIGKLNCHICTTIASVLTEYSMLVYRI